MTEKQEGGKKIEFWAKTEKRLRFLLSLLFVLSVIFIFLAANSPEGSILIAKFETIKRERENRIHFQKLLSQDPAMGSLISQFQLGSFCLFAIL